MMHSKTTRQVTLALTLLLVFSFAGCSLPGKGTPSPSPSSSPDPTPPPSIDIDFAAAYPALSPVELGADGYTAEKNGLALSIDGNGMLRKIESDGRSLGLEGIYIDVGVNGKTLLDQVGYESFLDFNTWTLPTITPKTKPLPELTLEGVFEGDDSLVVIHSLGDFVWHTVYEYKSSGLLKVSARLQTVDPQKKHINGVTFIARGMDLDLETTSYEFPGNITSGVPSKVFRLADYPASYVTRTDYCNPIVHLQTGDSHLNVLFIDEHEKWGTAVYRNRDGGVNVANQPAVESYLAKGDTLEVGNMYIQLPKGDPYGAVVDFYDSMGWRAPEDGASDGAVYSGHPFGTMDSGFRDGKKLQEYAEYLDTIRAMGYKNVWLLPINQHQSGNVYTSTDFRKIHFIYGGDEGLKVYTDKAHELGMRVMLDYVPHGPAPQYPIVKDNPDWPSKRMDGSLQIEWDCVSFDYNNPGFYDHMVECVLYHASELGVDGSRIDCAMGGLSNWDPVEGLRPSSSGLRAGLNITKAIREGFLKAGKQPVILPENFHPVPQYAPYTDLFYDMTLFRMIHDMRVRNYDETRFAVELAYWLSVQRAVSPRGLVRLRFISNHDVVSWTWDKARPVKTYGTEKAKALWSLTHFIDGVPMIYQGDENPEIWRGQGENLVQFFTELNEAREKYLGNEYDIEYILNETAVVAFRRFTDREDRLVLINLSREELTFDASGYDKFLYNRGVALDGSTAVLSPYSAAILDKAD